MADEAMLSAIRKKKSDPIKDAVNAADEKDYQDSYGANQSGPASGGAAGERLRDEDNYAMGSSGGVTFRVSNNPDQEAKDQAESMKTIRKNRK